MNVTYKPKGAIMNVQSRDMDNIGHMTQNEYKQNKTKTHHIK